MLARRNCYSPIVEKVFNIVTELTGILKQEEFSADLQQYLAKNYPRYTDELTKLQDEISSKDQCIVICGERCKAKHDLLSGLCGEFITEASYMKIRNANLVIATEGFAGIRVFRKGGEFSDLTYSVEDIQKEQQKIKDHLDHASYDISIFRDCYVEISKADKSKVNTTFVDVADDFGKPVAIADYLRRTACVVCVVDIEKASDIEKANDVLNDVLRKINDFRPYNKSNVIFVPNKNWKRNHQKVASTNRKGHPRSNLSAEALQQVMPFVKTENVFDLSQLENINQFEEFVGRIKREVLFGEENHMKTHLQFLRGLVSRAVKGICVKEGLVQADNPKYGETLEKVSRTLSDVQQGYSMLSRRSTADIQDVLTELTKVVSTGERDFETQIEENPIKTEVSDEKSSRVVDFDFLEDLENPDSQLDSAVSSNEVVDSDFVDSQLSDSVGEWNNSVEKVSDAVSQSVFDLRQAVKLSESREELENPTERFQLLSDFVNQLLTIEDIQRELEDAPVKIDIPSETEGSEHTRRTLSFIEGQLRLGKVYEELERIISLKEYDGALKHELELVCPNYRASLVRRANDLKRTDSSIVIAGETNAGKTTLINRIIGKNLLISDHLSNTGRVCRVRNSAKKGIRLYTKENQLIKELEIEKSTELKETLRKYSEKKNADCPANVHYVDVLYPVKILKGDVMIVDTPGMNEEEKIKSMLNEYLPNALSFIFVLNVANDGGVQCDRIPKLLTLIQEKKEDMPCFDEQEVLFVTNKWDTVAIPEPLTDSDDEKDEDEMQKYYEEHRKEEMERIWKTVLQKIENVWPLQDEKNAFQMSLKGKEQSEEFMRFLQKLGEMVVRNENKRMREHLCFLIEFTHNAERGIKARLRIFDLSDEEYQEKIFQMEQKISGMEDECKKIEKNLKQELKAKLARLSKDLAQDMKGSVWKDKALNPPGKKPIKEMRFRDLATEIPDRIHDMIKKWIKDGECRKEIEDTENKMIDEFIIMQKRLASIEQDLIGENTETESDSNVPLVFGIAATSPLWVPLLLVAGVLCLAVVILLSPLIIAKVYQYTREEKKEKVIDMIYSRCIQNIDERAIKNSLKPVVKPVKEQIKKCFGAYLPDHLKSIRETIETLKRERRYLKERKDLFLYLNDTFTNARKQIRDLRKDLNMTQ